MLTLRNIVIFLVLALLAGGGFLAYSGKWTALFGRGGESATGTGYTIEEIPIEKAIPPPDYNREVKFAPGTSEEVKKAVMLNVAELTARLKKSTLDFDAWLSLGSVYKIAGDYEGARVVWEYLGAVSPGNYPSFANLGDLYHHYLKDYAKAEANYKKAIGNEKSYIDGYRSLYELYRYSYPGKGTEAAAILKKGIAANPANAGLVVVLAAFYRDMGDKENALLYYDKAITLAASQGDRELVSALEADKAAIR